jgi:hypothetical protein
MKKLLLFRYDVIFSLFLKIIMVILLIISIWNLDWVWILGSVLAIIISLIPTVLKRNFNVTLPWMLDFLIVFALFLHIGGGVLNAYHTIPLYDKFAHFISSILVTFLAFISIYILDKYWDGLHMDKYAMAFFVVITAMALGVVWEFYEWGTDLVFGTNEQWGLQDTMSDLLVDTIGGIIVAIIGVSLIKKGRFEEITKDLGERINSSIIHRNKD